MKTIAQLIEEGRQRQLQDQLWALHHQMFPDADPLAPLWPGGPSRGVLAHRVAEPKDAERIEEMVRELKLGRPETCL